VVVSQPDTADLGFGEFPAPSEPSDIEIPPQMGRLAQPEGQLNILILGSDQRPNDGGFRTDVIELLTLNTRDNTVSLTSFPRDLYVYHPGWKMFRINGGMVHGGFEQMAQTFAYNFGVRPDHYMQINFSGFESVVDQLGGIDVQVAQGLTDEREGPGDFSVPAGTVHMDGETALWYVRSRGTSSDFSRTQRQQEVLTAIFFKLFSLNALANAPQLYDQYKSLVKTDLAITDLLPLIGLATSIGGSPSAIHRYAIGPNEVQSWTTASGGAVLLPQQEKVRAIMEQALNSSSAQ
jgi:LCP family protein required for cell wall assembly